MQRRTRWIVGAAAAAAFIAAGTGVAVAASGDDSDTPITGSALDQASAAALAHTGEGRVSDTEVGDEEGYYEVEVTLADGSEVDVHLDEAFVVLGQEAEGTGDSDDD